MVLLPCLGDLSEALEACCVEVGRLRGRTSGALDMGCVETVMVRDSEMEVPSGSEPAVVAWDCSEAKDSPLFPIKLLP